MTIKYPVPSAQRMRLFSRSFASQEYIPLSLRSRFRSVKTFRCTESLFGSGILLVKAASEWRLCRRDTVAFSSLVEQFISKFLPRYPSKIVFGCIRNARGSVCNEDKNIYLSRIVDLEESEKLVSTDEFRLPGTVAATSPIKLHKHE